MRANATIEIFLGNSNDNIITLVLVREKCYRLLLHVMSASTTIEILFGNSTHDMRTLVLVWKWNHISYRYVVLCYFYC